MFKIGLKSNKKIWNANKKAVKKFAVVGAMAILCMGSNATHAQGILPCAVNKTREATLDCSDDMAAIMKILREELNGWEGYTCSFLAMLSDGEIAKLYEDGLKIMSRTEQKN